MLRTLERAPRLEIAGAEARDAEAREILARAALSRPRPRLAPRRQRSWARRIVRCAWSHEVAGPAAIARDTRVARPGCRAVLGHGAMRSRIASGGAHWSARSSSGSAPPWPARAGRPAYRAHGRAWARDAMRSSRRDHGVAHARRITAWTYAEREEASSRASDRPALAGASPSRRAARTVGGIERSSAEKNR